MIKEFLCQTKCLNEFILKSNKIGDEGMTVIAEAFLGAQSKIQLLDLTQTNITAEAFRVVVGNMRVNHSLKTLICDKNNLGTSYAFSRISQIIATGNYLKVLSLKSCGLNDNFGVPFSEALRTNKGLVKFNFYDNLLTSRTLSTLAVAIRESSGSL